MSKFCCPPVPHAPDLSPAHYLHSSHFLYTHGGGQQCGPLSLALGANIWPLCTTRKSGASAIEGRPPVALPVEGRHHPGARRQQVWLGTCGPVSSCPDGPDSQSSRHVGNLPFGRLPLRSIPRPRARAPSRGLGWQRGPVQVPLMFRVDFEWPEKSQGMASCTGRPGSGSSAPAVGPPRLSLPTVWGGCPRPRLPCWPTRSGTWAMRTSVAAAS